MRTLYHSPLHPQCRKIRLILDELHSPYSSQEIDIWAEPERIYAVNPTGEIPVLVEQDSTVIAGNYAVTEYLHEQSRDLVLFGESIVERAAIRKCMDWFDTTFHHDVIGTLFHEKVIKRLSRSGSPETQKLREGKERLHHYLTMLDDLLETQPWLTNEQLTVADLAAGAYISVLDFTGDIEWQHFEKTKQWYALLKSRPSFQKLFHDKVRGFTPPPYFDNPDF